MADELKTVQRINETSSLTLKVITDVSEAGAKIYKSRTISLVNPALTDAVFLTCGNTLAQLQEFELDSILRTNKAEIRDVT